MLAKTLPPSEVSCQANLGKDLKKGLPRTNPGAEEMTQWAPAFPTKPDSVSLSPKPTCLRRELTSHKSDYMCHAHAHARTHACTHARAHTHTMFFLKKNHIFKTFKESF